MRFDLTDLRLFQAIDETGSITAGAQRLHMTLASASERVRGMEAMLGAPLLQRHARGVSVTPAGRSLAQHACHILRQMDALHDDLAQYGQGLKTHIRLMCNTSALSEYLPNALSLFLSAHDRVSVDVNERTSEEIAPALRAGLCDIGIVSDRVELDALTVQPFRDDPLVLVVHADHAPARRESVALEELVDLPFIGLAPGSALQTHIAAHARRQGHTLQYRVRMGSMQAVCMMAGLGIGCAIIPRTAAKRYATDMAITLITLRDGWANRRLVLCTRPNDRLPALTQTLMKYLLAHAPAI